MKTKIFIAIFLFINFFFIQIEQISKIDLSNQTNFYESTLNWNKNFKNKLYQGVGEIINIGNKNIFIKIDDEKPIILKLTIDQISLKYKNQLMKLIDKKINFKAQIKRFEKEKKIFNGELLLFY
tara:strand:+ start:88 stop:459 length:372 start_codon:yes stop_codon:yes gene_type:complete